MTSDSFRMSDPIVLEHPYLWVNTYPGDPTPIEPTVITVKTKIEWVVPSVEAMRSEDV